MIESNQLTFYVPVQKENSCSVPFYDSSVAAGFPSPADEYTDCKLDINELMINHINDTFYVKVSGDSMIDAGIYNGDLLVVDRSLTANHNDIVIANVNGDFCVKVLDIKNERPILRSRNKQYKDIEILESTSFSIFGVVTGVVRKLK